jgi:predicted ArsR family transcriptional regulator
MRQIGDDEAKRLIEHYLLSHPDHSLDEMATALEMPQDQARRLMNEVVVPETVPETGNTPNEGD